MVSSSPAPGPVHREERSKSVAEYEYFKARVEDRIEAIGGRMGTAKRLISVSFQLRF